MTPKKETSILLKEYNKIIILVATETGNTKPCCCSNQLNDLVHFQCNQFHVTQIH